MFFSSSALKHWFSFLLFNLILWEFAHTLSVTKIESAPQTFQVQGMEMEVVRVNVYFDKNLFVSNPIGSFCDSSFLGGGGGGNNGGSSDDGKNEGSGDSTSRSGGGEITFSPTVSRTKDMTMCHWVMMSMLYGQTPAMSPIDLNCENVNHFTGTGTSPPSSQDGPSFILSSCKDDSLRSILTFFLSQGNSVDDNQLIRSNCMSVIFLDKQKNPSSSEIRALSRIPDMVQKFRTDKCVVTVKKGVTFFEDKTGSIGLAADYKVTGDKISPMTFNCDRRKLKNLLTEYKESVDQLNSLTNLNEIQATLIKINLLTVSDSWIACVSILENSAKLQKYNSTIISKDCVYAKDTPEYDQDPCCSKKLSMTKCCAPRLVQTSYTALSGINVDYVVQTCNVGEDNIDSLLTMFNNYASAVSVINDPNVGCTAQTKAAFGGKTFDMNSAVRQYTSFVEECGKAIFGNSYGMIYGGGGYRSSSMKGPDCLTDNDCYTSCVFENAQDKNDPSAKGSCAIPWVNQTSVIIKCFLDKMDISLKGLLARQWGINRANDQNLFASAFSEKVTMEACTGENSWAFAGGWYYVNTYYYGCYSNGYGSQPCPNSPPVPIGYDQSNKPIYNSTIYADIMKGKYYRYWGEPPNGQSSNYFFLPENKAECLRETRCNMWSMDGKGCDSDNLMNGKMTCGLSYDGLSFNEMSVPGYCEVEVPWELSSKYSQNVGNWYTDNPYKKACEIDMKLQYGNFFTGGGCMDKNFTSADSCNAQCTGSAGIKPSVPQKCYNANIKDWNQCYKAFSTIGGYGYVEYIYDPVTFESIQICVDNYIPNGKSCADLSSLCFSFGPILTDQKSVDNYIANKCKRSICFSPVISTEQNCYSPLMTALPKDSNNNPLAYTWGYFDRSLNNSKGLCIVSISPNSMYSGGSAVYNGVDFSTTNFDASKACAALGLKFYRGKSWKAGIRNTEALCKEGICEYNYNLPSEKCLAMERCDRSCRSCVSSGQTQSMCIRPYDGICSDQMTINGTARCVFTEPDSVKLCQKANSSILLTCDQLSRDKCWDNPYSPKLSCQWGYTECKDEQMCKSKGECNDWDLGNSGKYYGDLDDIDLQIRNDPSFNESIVTCVLPASMNDYGDVDCYNPYKAITAAYPKSSYSQRFGSCYYSGIDRNFCLRLNGKPFNRRAKTKESCEALKGCCEPQNNCDWLLTHKSPTECTACGGYMKSYYQWSGGNWEKAKMLKTQWVQKTVSQVRQWTRVLDWQKFFDYAYRAAYAQINMIMKNEILCRLGPIGDYLDRVACACGSNTDSSECSTTFANKQQVISDAKMLCGETRDVRNGPLRVFFNEKSLLNCSSEVSVEIGRVEPSPKNTKTNSSDSVSVNKRSSYVNLEPRASVSSNCYAYVQNEKDAFIGQLRGDCVLLNPSGSVAGVEICMPLKDSIPLDLQSYPVKGVALRTVNENGDEKYTASNIYTNVFEGNKQFCVSVDSKGTFCPVNLLTSWNTTVSRARPSCDVSSSVIDAINTANARLAGSATNLRFKTQPTSVSAGTPMTPAIVVHFLDKDGNIATDAAASATLVFSTKTSASIIGKARVVAVGGVATFDDVAVNLAGTGYTFTVQSSVLAMDTSASFDISPGAPYKLSFKRQPGGAVQNEQFLQMPIVMIVDAYGNRVNGTSANIVLTLYLGSTLTALGPSITTTGVISQFTGEFEFPNLSIANINNGYRLVVSDASGVLIAATSLPFNVVSRSGFAVKLGFVQYPTSGYAGIAFSSQPIVEALDFVNQRVTTTQGMVTLSITSGTGADNANIIGTKSLSFIGGVAEFSGIAIDRAGSAYSLTASTNGLKNAVSTAFNVVGPAKLVFATQPTGKINSTFSVVINVLAADNSVFKDGSLKIQLSIKLGTGKPKAVLAGIVSRNSVNGVATFPSLNIADPGENYVLTAVDSNGAYIAQSLPFTVVSAGGQSNDETSGGGTVNEVIKNIAGALNLDPQIVAAAAGGGVIVVAGIFFAALSQRKKNMRKIDAARRRQKTSEAAAIRMEEGHAQPMGRFPSIETLAIQLNIPKLIEASAHGYTAHDVLNERYDVLSRKIPITADEYARIKQYKLANGIR